MSMTRRWLPLLLCAGFLIPAAVGATPGSGAGSTATYPAIPPKFVPACQDSLARAEDKSIALGCLIQASHAAGDTTFKTFFTRVFEGGVYVADLPGKPGALVIPGEDLEVNGVYVRSVRLALPDVPVLDAAGKPLMLAS